MYTNLTNQAVIGRIRDFCISVDSDFSRQVAETLLKSPLEIKNLKLDPAQYLTANSSTSSGTRSLSQKS